MSLKKKLNFAGIILFGFFIFFSAILVRFKSSGFDLNFTLALQRYIPRAFDLPFSVFSVLGSAEITFAIWLGLTLFLFLRHSYRAVFGLILLPVVSVLEIIAKAFIYHPQPPLALYRGVLSLDLPSEHIRANFSYPSGHVTRTAFLIMFLLIFISIKKIRYRKVMQIFLSLTLVFMLISRVYLGEHWATDVLGGLLLGSAAGLFSAAVMIP